MAALIRNTTIVELVMIFEKPPGFSRNSVAPLNFLDWKEQSQAIDVVASSGSWHTLTDQREPQRVVSRR